MKKTFLCMFFRKKDIEKLNSKINQFGINKRINLNVFIYFRILFSVLVFLFAFVFSTNILLSIVLSILIYILIYYFVIEVELKKRSLVLEKESINFFELLILALSSNNLERSINIVCNNYSSSISEEFKEALERIKYGKSFNESIKEITNRIPSENVNNIIMNIIYSNEYGNDLIKSLKNSIIYLREKRLMDVRFEINKIPNKVSIYSVLFFLPLVLLLILAPVLIEFLFTS